MPERQESGRSYPDTHAEFRKRDREYFELIGRQVIYGNQVLPIIAFQWLRFGAGHLFTLQLPDGSEMGAQRRDFYVLPTRDQLVAVIDDTTREHLWDKVPGSADDAFEFEPVAPKVADAVLALFSTTSTEGDTQ